MAATVDPAQQRVMRSEASGSPYSYAIQEIDDQHGEMAALVSTYLPDAAVVTIITINGLQNGQMILHDPNIDKKLIAERLRICANCLEASA